jgi:hypothetical protein
MYRPGGTPGGTEIRVPFDIPTPLGSRCACPPTPFLAPFCKVHLPGFVGPQRNPPATIPAMAVGLNDPQFRSKFPRREPGVGRRAETLVPPPTATRAGPRIGLPPTTLLLRDTRKPPAAERVRERRWRAAVPRPSAVGPGLRMCAANARSSPPHAPSASARLNAHTLRSG